MKRLIEIQQKLKAPKNQKNAFGGYNYRSCEDILEAVKPLLAKQNLALLIEDNIIAIDGRFYIKATATIVDDEGKVVAQTSALAREEESKKGMDASQLTGSTSSYARKYALNGLFAIDDTKDADAANTHGKEETNSDAKLIAGFSKCNNLEELVKYKDDNKDKVKDIKAFRAEYTKVYHKFAEEQ